MDSFLVALWRKRKKVLTYSEICSLGSTKLMFDMWRPISCNTLYT